jgi:DNA-binding NtrC family response regulator
LYVQPAGQPDALVPQIKSAGWNVHVARDTSQAREILNHTNVHVGLALLDGSDSSRQEMFELWPVSGRMEWVAMLQAACLQSQKFSRLISEYCYDYHTLPADLNRLLFSLGHAYGMATMTRTISQESEEKFSQYEMVGASPIMQELFHAVRKIASVDAPVLVTGESGVGKELAALAIHERSARASGPFVAVNCGALPANLIQSELFGYEKGAFTGAAGRKIGHLESAAGGTVFLDEIGDLSLDLQVNLLRFLQESTIERVGGTEKISVDVRVIAATHVDLEKAVAEGRFREDLYYRLHVLNLKVPSLREREGDVEVLARFFFEKFSKERRPNLRGFSHKALQALAEHDWPGNVRELINRVRRAMVMSDKRLITPEDLGLHAAAPKRRLMSLEEARIEAERAAIHYSLNRCRNNVSRTARELGVSRVTLYRLMEKYQIGA